MNDTPLTHEQIKQICALSLENTKLTAQVVSAHHKLIEALGAVLPNSVSLKLLSEIEQLEAVALRTAALVEPVKKKLGLD